MPPELGPQVPNSFQEMSSGVSRMQENLTAEPGTPPGEITAFPQTLQLMRRGLTAPAVGPWGLASNAK